MESLRSRSLIGTRMAFQTKEHLLKNHMKMIFKCERSEIKGQSVKFA